VAAWVHTVGIDRILERANVAKASLYGTFGSKEDLVCAFLNASVEGPRGATPVRGVATKHRAWMRSFFEELVKEMGAKDPRSVAVQLTILYDGAVVSSLMEAAPPAATYARRMATLLLDAEEKAPKPAPRPARFKSKPRSAASS
jgi:AcrR family transcriptional regulator